MASDVSASYLAESRSSTVQGVMWVMAIVPLVFVCMRLYVRVFLKRVFGWDDFIIIIAVVSILSYFPNMDISRILTSLPFRSAV
jgi:hypothetical protein